MQRRNNNQNNEKKGSGNLALGALVVGGLVALGAYFYGKEKGKEEQEKEKEEKHKKIEKDPIKYKKKTNYKPEDLDKYFPGENDVLCPITLSKSINIFFSIQQLCFFLLSLYRSIIF